MLSNVVNPVSALYKKKFRKLMHLLLYFKPFGYGIYNREKILPAYELP